MTSSISQTCPEVGETLPSKKNRYTVSKVELSLYCPVHGMDLWNLFFRGFIKMQDGRGRVSLLWGEV